MEERVCRVLDLGLIDYQEAYKLQRQLVCRRAGGSADYLMLAAHPPVFTIGRKGSRREITAAPGLLDQVGIKVAETDRGGAVTYHGPGQLVAYPVLHLDRHGRDIHKLLHRYEEVVLAVLYQYGIPGKRIKEYPGVWVENNKICALGIGITRWITYHGFALNVNTNLDHYNYIIPCGIAHLGVTSMRQVLGQPVAETGVRRAVAEELGRVFNLEMLWDEAAEYSRNDHSSVAGQCEKGARP
ncbi:MAG: lipoyl(octanoyl) transferase LipB [Bacillota bacterium]